ncbi:MAG: YibE/F family protein [Thermoleophilaceae bacterium]
MLAALALATGIGLAILWPGDDPGGTDLGGLVAGETEAAEVVGISAEGCEALAGPGCRLVLFELRSGPNEGEQSALTLPGGDALAPELQPGDSVRVLRNVPSGIDPALARELPIDDVSTQPFAFVDFERRAPLVWLAIAFAILVIAFGRGRGALSLIGLAASLALVIAFVAPAILDGAAPLPVAIVGALAIMFVTVALTHGANAKSAAAMLGTAASLLLTALLALAFVELAHITGLSSEEATLLQGSAPGELSLQGLVLAGMVIGALGVLDDVTVSQASTVMALRRANPAQHAGELYRNALAVGRDHLGATVNTLVLAYAGAALPVLLIFSSQGTSVGEALNREPVATEVVAMLVGSIGLIVAVPLTTAVAAALASRLPASALPEHGHEHTH